MKEKIVFLVISIILLASPSIAKAETNVDVDFTDAITNEVGEGFSWDNDNKILTLSGVSWNNGVFLPSDSIIEVTENSVNSINSTTEAPITASGGLTIKGKGNLTLTTPVTSGAGYAALTGVNDLVVEDVTLTTKGLQGLRANNITIKDSILDIEGYNYGIYVIPSISGEDIGVSLINCTGTITGIQVQGIEINNNLSGSATLNIDNSNNLIITGNITNTKLSGSFSRSGARVIAKGSGANATINIKNSKNIEFYGTNTGIGMDCTSCEATTSEDKDGKTSLNIEDSVVKAETVTKTWAAFFVNNSSNGADSSANILIKNSKVSALAPNDVAIMTSTRKAPSSIIVNNSVVELAGFYAGIRAKSNTTTDAEIFVIENSLIVVVDEVGNSYNALDEMDKAVSSDGSSGIDENSKVIAPKDCVITIKEDGNWDIPDEGTITINGEESNFIYGGIIKTTGDVLPYITSVNDDSEYVDLEEALTASKEGDSVELLIPTGNEKVNLPYGVTLTTPVSIDVKTNEYGFKVKGEIKEDKYIYSVVPADKFKVIYHFNYGQDKVVIKEGYDQNYYQLDTDIFNEPEDMAFSHFIINGKKYYKGDKYLITGDIDVYMHWIKIVNPDTSDNIKTHFYLVVSSFIGLVLTLIYFIKKR